MKKQILLLLLIVPFSLFAQEALLPILWLKGDNGHTNDNYWYDVSGNGNHAFFNNSMASRHPDSLLNYNPSFFLSSADDFFYIPHIIFSKGRASAIAVYQCADSTRENGLWSWLVDTTSSIGLTTQRILNEDANIQYDTINRQYAVIHSLEHKWHHDFSDSLITDVHVGSTDSLSFYGKLSEFILFDGNPDDSSMVRWLSYLAVKYGITLYHTNYLNSQNVCIWNNTAQSQYSHTIAGVGKDTVFGLCQKQTFVIPYNTVLTNNSYGSITFGIGSPAIDNSHNTASISEGNFILMGLDSNTLGTPTELYLNNDTTYTSYCHGLVQVTGSEATQYYTFLRIPADFSEDLSRYILMIDRSGTGNFALPDLTLVMPDTAGRIIQYNNIQWDTDGNGHDVFCIIFADSNTMESRKLQAGNANSTIIDEQSQQSDVSIVEVPHESISLPGNSQLDCSIYPNPTSGQYSIAIHQSAIGDVIIRIYDATGKSVTTLHGTDKQNYLFHGKIGVSGTYFIEITGQQERRTLKMVVE